MPEKAKSDSTQAGEFVREEMHHVRKGKHGARSPQQAIAIGLSKARRAGVDLPPPSSNGKVRHKAQRDTAIGHGAKRKSPSAKRSRSRSEVLKKEGHASASHAALSRHAKKASHQRSHTQRSQAAKKAARTRSRHKAQHH